MAGVGGMPDAVRFVVKRDVARHDRIVEHAAGFAHAAHAGDELAHDFGPLGIGEIHVVGDGERIGAVAVKLRHVSTTACFVPSSGSAVT